MSCYESSVKSKYSKDRGYRGYSGYYENVFYILCYEFNGLMLPAKMYILLCLYVLYLR